MTIGMPGVLTAGAAVFAMVSGVTGMTSAQLCATGNTTVSGNSYCQRVTRILYRPVNQTGTYNETTSMNAAAGICDHQPVSYGGDLSPFEELSVHLRGPLTLYNLAVYTAPATVGGMKAKRHTHAHQHLHGRRKNGRRKNGRQLEGRQAKAKRAAGDMDTATIDGQAVHFMNVYDGHNEGGPAFPRKAAEPPGYSSRNGVGSVTTDTGSSSPTVTRNVDGANSSMVNVTRSNAPESSSILAQNVGSFSGSASAITPTTQQPVAAPSTSDDWEIIASYNIAEPASATGLVWLNNRGDPAYSGTFDNSFGNSLSYASSDGYSPVRGPTPFNGILNSSDVEIIAFFDQTCSPAGECGFFRNGTVAYHGFTAPSKAFFFRFLMPSVGNTSGNVYTLENAPAAWTLNAHIPRVLQYGNDRNNIPCSCWATGCGEFDLFEILASGDTRAKSCLHRPGNVEGGDSNYFARPVDNPINFAMIMDDTDIVVTVVNDSFEFPDALNARQIADYMYVDPNSDTQSIFTFST